MTTVDDVSIRNVTYHDWDAWRIEHGPLALTLVPQVGGRIMGMAWHGQELSFVNPACAGRVLDVAAIADVRDCKRELGFLLWGGDKTWLAPQSGWSDEVPFIDLDSGAYELNIEEDSGSVHMVSPVCRGTGVQITRLVRVGQRPAAWQVAHRLHNRSDQQVTWAPWDVAMVLRPATVYVPTRAGSAYPDGLRTFDDEGVSAAVRDDVVCLADGYAVIGCHDPVKFKYGADGDAGWLLAVFEGGPRGLIGLRKSVPTFQPGPYAHGCVAEVFNSEDFPYLELELHGPLVTLEPGEEFTLIEEADLFDLDRLPEGPVEALASLGH